MAVSARDKGTENGQELRSNRAFFHIKSYLQSDVDGEVGTSPTEKSDNVTPGASETIQKEERRQAVSFFQEDDCSDGPTQDRKSKDYNVWYRPQVPPDVFLTAQR